MSVKVKNYQWHRDWHDKMMGDPGYQGLNAEARGIYQTCRNLAGSTNNNGSIKVGTAVPMNTVALARFLSGTIPEMTPARARSLIRKIVASGLFKECGDGRILITDWAADQQCAWSSEAERQRRSRARHAGGDEGYGPASQGATPGPSRGRGGEGVCGTGGGPRGGPRIFPAPQAPAGGAALPAPPPSTSISTGFDSGVTCHKETCDTSHKEDRNEGRKKKPYGFRTSTGAPSSAPTGGGAGKAGGSLQAAQAMFGGEPNFDLVPLEQLVTVACETVGQWKPFDKNTYAKKLSEMVERYGVDGAAMRFRSALREIRDAIKTGKAKYPPSLLTMILGDYAAGRGHNP